MSEQDENTETTVEQQIKIFPRNLTARAAYVVPGNPVVSRTEDGVDNCFPGLEMDAKNIQKYFMPGLYFEVYGDDGAQLVSMTPKKLAQVYKDAGLTKKDIEAGLYLWAFKGRIESTQSSANPPVTKFNDTYNLGGLYCWRKINALYPGKLAIVVAKGVPKEDAPRWAKIDAQIQQHFDDGTNVIHRNKDGEFKYAIFVGSRAQYLNEQGVLDPDVYQPGELTRTLCTPWTYDFRDCQCFYWASNKPDVVSSEDAKYPYLNFQRKNWQVEPQTEDIANNYVGRRKRELDYSDLMTDWAQLRPVVNGRECGQGYVPPAGPTQSSVLDRQGIIDELTYLATVEHALAVQYLYAYYSIDAPYELPDDPSTDTLNIWNSAQVIFNIAVDEMRHFRWANQALKLLGAPITVDRATMLGRNLKVPFYLQSMNCEQLQWFIDVERPSKDTSAGLDGMYVGLLRSVKQVPDEEIDSTTKRLIVEIMKLIIDEGEDHYVRFSNAELNLSLYTIQTKGQTPPKPEVKGARDDYPNWLRRGAWFEDAANPNADIPIDTQVGNPKVETTGDAHILQLQSDAFYYGLLTTLTIAFALQDDKYSGAALRQAITMMFAMNKLNFDLANLEATPLFTLPPQFAADPTFQTTASAKLLLQSAKDKLTAAGVDLDIHIDAGPHQGTIQAVFDYFEKVCDYFDDK